MIEKETKMNLPDLPNEVEELVNKLHSGQELGASRNIRQINNLFCAIADFWKAEDAQQLINTLLDTGEYFIKTRGKNTPAIGNAINFVLGGINEIPSKNTKNIQDYIHEKRDEYNKNSLQNIKKIAKYGANLLMECDSILAFDYSSSMLAVLEEVSHRDKQLHLIVPESRDLDGGRPIITEATAMGHSAHFIIDIAFHHYIKKVDAVIFGAESFFLNGDCANTVGSYPIAEFAHHYNIPVYVPTELIKVDGRSIRGIKKPMKLDDYSTLLDYPGSFKHPDLIEIKSSAFDIVPAKLISAYITNQGVIPSNNIWGVALEFLKINQDSLKRREHNE